MEFTKDQAEALASLILTDGVDHATLATLLLHLYEEGYANGATDAVLGRWEDDDIVQFLGEDEIAEVLEEGQ
jgi:hypothetical protein